MLFLSWVVCKIHDFHSSVQFFHRITVQLKLDGTSGDCLVQPAWSKQGQLEQVTRVCVQSGFEYIHLKGWSLHHLSGQPLSVFDHSQNKKVVFLCFDGITCISSCALCLRCFLEYHEELTFFSRAAGDILMQQKLYERAQNSWLSKCENKYSVSYHHQQIGNKRHKVKSPFLVTEVTSSVPHLVLCCSVCWGLSTWTGFSCWHSKASQDHVLIREKANNKTNKYKVKV